MRFPLADEGWGSGGAVPQQFPAVPPSLLPPEPTEKPQCNPWGGAGTGASLPAEPSEKSRTGYSCVLTVPRASPRLESQGRQSPGSSARDSPSATSISRTGNFQSWKYSRKPTLVLKNHGQVQSLQSQGAAMVTAAWAAPCQHSRAAATRGQHLGRGITRQGQHRGCHSRDGSERPARADSSPGLPGFDLYCSSRAVCSHLRLPREGWERRAGAGWQLRAGTQAAAGQAAPAPLQRLLRSPAGPEPRVQSRLLQKPGLGEPRQMGGSQGVAMHD